MMFIKYWKVKFSEMLMSGITGIPFWRSITFIHLFFLFRKMYSKLLIKRVLKIIIN